MSQTPQIDVVRTVAESLQQAAQALDLSAGVRPRGVVDRTGDGVAWVRGLPDVGYEELVEFDSGASGMAHDLRAGGLGVILLSGGESVAAGDGVAGLGRLPSLPVGDELLGRVLDPLGNPLDGGPAPHGRQLAPLFRPAPRLIDRKPVDQPLLTGVLVIDAAIPIGRGQRELIIGDRNVGKSALALDVVTAQRSDDVACVYVVIGQPMSRILNLRETLRRQDAMQNAVVIAADASMSPGLQYLAPYSGMTVSEWFRDRGRDALVVFDDLTKHADSYRELALLLGRPPGREAFPGDVFYLHAELLERAAPRNSQAGGGSITALPIVETTDSDISAYIPTNLISITDGQIYLDTGRFERNQRPAVDVGRSVSRIGSAAQPEPTKAAAGNLRILISRFEALEALTRVGLDIDPATQRTIQRGRVMRELLQQPRFRRRGTCEQVLTLTMVSEGWLDDVPPSSVRALVGKVLERFRDRQPEICEVFDSGTSPSAEWQPELHDCLQSVLKSASR